MTGRHEGEADNLAAIAGGLLGCLGFLAFLGWVAYLLVTNHPSHQDLVIFATIIAVILDAVFVSEWREQRRFPRNLTSASLLVAIYLTSLLAPSWRWVNWAEYAVAAGAAVSLIQV